jgi:hypothetical protein
MPPYTKAQSTFHSEREAKEKKVPKPIAKISEKKKAELEASGPSRKDFTGNRLYSVEDLKKLQKEVVRTNKKRKPVKSKPDPEAKLWKEFSIYIRVRDADLSGMCRCITSGRLIRWTKTDCGHGISRGIRSTKYHEQNNHAQCRKDNRYKEGCKDQYAKEVDRRYGSGTWDQLLVLSKTTQKVFSQEEIDRLASHYKSLADQIKK